MADECYIAIMAATAGLSRTRCELEKIRDMAEAGKVDQSKLDGSLERLGTGRTAFSADMTKETLSKCTCTPVSELENLTAKLIFKATETGWSINPKELKRQAEDAIKNMDEVWDKFSELLLKKCPR